MKKFLTLLSLVLALAFVGCRGGASDADLQKSADAAVKAKAPTATVTVKDGVATITGIANDAAAKDAATAAAKVEGIKSVTNNMTMATPTPVAQMASGDDTSVKSKIEANLRAKNITGVMVDVKGGVATLTGTVSDAKFVEAVQAANDAKPGKVENKLVKGK